MRLGGGRIGKWQWCLETQWPDVFRPVECAWVEFTFVQFTVEREGYLDELDGFGPKAWDVWVGLLGFKVGMSNCYNYARNDEPVPEPAAGEVERV